MYLIILYKNYEPALGGNKYFSDIIAHAGKLCDFGKKTVSQTISIIARRTRAFVVLMYALLMLCNGISAAML